MQDSPIKDGGKSCDAADGKLSRHHSVEMPNTYVLLPGFNTDPDILAQTKLDRMPERVARIAHAIKCSSKIDDIVKGHFAWIKSYLIYPLS